jgi:hypothetical protein
MADESIFNKVHKKIIQSMKSKEITSTVIKADYIKKIEQVEVLTAQYTDYMPDENLHIDISLN